MLSMEWGNFELDGQKLYNTVDVAVKTSESFCMSLCHGIHECISNLKYKINGLDEGSIIAPPKSLVEVPDLVP